MEINSKKLIWLYRTCIFKKTKFTTNKAELKQVVEALNIKNINKRNEYLENTICEYIDNYYKPMGNICGFENGKCYAQRNNDKFNGCCRLCRHVTCQGCPSKNIACKLFNCSEVKSRYKILDKKDIILLKCFSFRNRVIAVHTYFSSKEEVLEDMKYPLLIALIREYIRTLKGIKKNKHKM